MAEDFDFDEWHERFPLHWDEQGWPSKRSTWRFRDHPQMRVQVFGCDFDDVQAFVFWDGSLEELARLFSYENTERWSIDEERLVCGAGGISRDQRWRDTGPPLRVIFDRPMFGGPDTWHAGLKRGWEGFNLPPFEPIDPWDPAIGPRGDSAGPVDRT
jgi:hypothetical protein